jgi:hypothetical protein
VKEKMTETELAGVVTAWLEKTSWEVYPEVVINGFGGRPDIIASRNTICQVIECKINTNITVVEQAMRWRNPHRDVSHGMPHLIWIAVQNYTFGSNSVLRMIVEQMGIGVISVSKYNGFGKYYVDNPSRVVIGDDSYNIEQRIPARIQPGSRQFGQRLIQQLNPDMKIAMPGARGGCTEYMTPFKRTMNLVRRVVADGKEHHCKTIVDVINMMGGHHYSSDISARNQIYRLCHLAGCEPGSLPMRIRLKNENLPHD